MARPLKRMPTEQEWEDEFTVERCFQPELGGSMLYVEPLFNGHTFDELRHEEITAFKLFQMENGKPPKALCLTKKDVEMVLDIVNRHLDELARFNAKYRE